MHSGHVKMKAHFKNKIKILLLKHIQFDFIKKWIILCCSETLCVYCLKMGVDDVNRLLFLFFNFPVPTCSSSCLTIWAK